MGQNWHAKDMTRKPKEWKNGESNGEPNNPPPVGKANKRSIWTVASKNYNGGHYATFPESLVKDCILAGCPEDGIVLDPFAGHNTTGLVARKLNRNFIGFELNPEYIEQSERRLNKALGLFA